MIATKESAKKTENPYLRRGDEGAGKPDRNPGRG
jgi:hypothetical protein